MFVNFETVILHKIQNIFSSLADKVNHYNTKSGKVLGSPTSLMLCIICRLSVTIGNTSLSILLFLFGIFIFTFTILDKQ